MIPNQKIKNKIFELQQKIGKWNRYYYALQRPLVADEVYDAHLKELQKLEKQFSFNDEQLVSKKVGYLELGIFPKIKHATKMFSLGNAFNKEDLEKFNKKIEKVTNGNNSYIVEPKIDGLSINFGFKNNYFDFAATRGNGIEGENITENIGFFDFCSSILKKKFPWPEFELRGELFLTFSEFKKINQKIKTDQENEIKKSWQTFISEAINKTKTLNLDLITDNKIPQNDNEVVLLTSQNDFENGTNLKKKKNNIKILFCSLLAENLKFCSTLNLKKKQEVKFYSKKNLFFAEVNVSFNFSQFPFVNPRNAAAGTIRQLNKDLFAERKLSVYFYDLIIPGKNFKTHQEVLDQIKMLGFPVFEGNKVCKNLKEVEETVQFFTTERPNIEFPIDGMVIKVNEKFFYPILGVNERFPHYSIAYKFPAVKGTTKITNIIATVGRTGRITYVAELEAIFLAGSIVKASTLHNADYIEKLDIRIGDWVEIKKAGDIIPKVIKVFFEKRTTNLPKWKKAENCPACNSELVQKENKIDYYCINLMCDEKKIRTLIHFVGKTGMNIYGISESLIRIFYEKKIINNPLDIYLLTTEKQKLMSMIKNNTLEKFGEKSIDKLIYSINKSKKNPWYYLLSSLNIDNLGKITAREIAKKFPTPKLFFDATIAEFVEIDGVGEITAESIHTSIHQPQLKLLLESLIVNGVGSIKTDTISPTKMYFMWSGKSVVLTGSWSQPRTEIEKLLTSHGASIKSAVSSKTDFLMYGNNAGSKLALAKKLNVKILSEQNFWKHVNEY